MARYFNTTGPCIPAEHYMLDPEPRCPGVMGLIEQKHFFVIRAPRQSAKTTEQGLTQLSRYMDTLDAKEGWLVLFDIKTQLPWEQRLYWKTVPRDKGAIHVVGA